MKMIQTKFYQLNAKTYQEWFFWLSLRGQGCWRVTPSLQRFRKEGLFSSSVLSAPILLSENRHSKTQSTKRTESRQNTAISVYERSYSSIYCRVWETVSLDIRYFGYRASFVLLFMPNFIACYPHGYIWVTISNRQIGELARHTNTNE